MQSETMVARGEPEALRDVLSGLIGRDARTRLDDSQRAAAAWAMVNGDTERRHTRKAYLADARRGGGPTLVVEVDSHALLSDFTAKRELYLGRLANYGLVVAEIRFRYAPTEAASRVRGAAPGVLRELDEAGRAQVEELSALVSESLRPAVARAVAASLRREVTGTEADDAA